MHSTEGKNQEEEVSTISYILGAISLFLALLIGVPLLTLGLIMMGSTIYFTAIGADAAGLGVIFALPMIVIGCFLSMGLIATHHFLKPGPETVKMIKLTVIIIAVLVSIYGLIKAVGFGLGTH